MRQRPRRLARLRVLTFTASACLVAQGCGSRRELAASTCAQHLQAIGRALSAYQRDHRELPPHLSDLYPRYLSDKSLLHCPADRSPGEPGYRGAAPDPKLPVSYLYEMSLAKQPAGFVLGPLPREQAITWRQVKTAQRLTFGDRVPVVRCHHHTRGSGLLGEPFTLNLTLTGQVYRSVSAWEYDPATVPVVLARLEEALAAGPQSFRRHWRPDRIAVYFFVAPPVPALRDRYRGIASKLAALARTDPAIADSGGPSAVGSLYRAAGDTRQAIAAYEADARRWEGDGPAAYPLADLYHVTGQDEKAVPLLLDLVAQEPQNSRYRELLDRAYEGARTHRKTSPSATATGVSARSGSRQKESGGGRPGAR